MKRSISQRLANRKRTILRRLERANGVAKYMRAYTGAGPMLNDAGLRYELADKVRGMAYGGAALFVRLARDVGLVNAIDKRLRLLKIHCPYHESDHVMNLAINALCDATCLEDIELRRNDCVFLDALGTASIPDPTTAGDFCRRFTKADVDDLHLAIDEARLNVWSRQAPEFFDEAVIEADGTFVSTRGELKKGMDISYKKQWGYHPLLVTLANTGEPLRIINRPGNAPSHEGAAEQFDEAIALCRRAGFRSIRLRGDTDFSQTRHLDRWHEAGVLFEFGFDAHQSLRLKAENLPEEAWKTLERPPRYVVRTTSRQRRADVKRSVIRRRNFLHKELKSEQVAEFDWRPVACRHTYRMRVVRKNISNESGQWRLWDDMRYFFYITNDTSRAPNETVFSCNDRCNQENLIAQLAGGVRALNAPVDNLVSNGAYMLMTSLGWTLKAWAALLVPVNPAHQEEHQKERHSLLKMEFKTFVNAVVLIPCQFVRQARRAILRVLTWNPYLPAFFRLAQVLRC